MVAIADLYPSDPNERVTKQIAEAAISRGDIEDKGAATMYPLSAMDPRSRFMNAFLRIENNPNTDTAADALKALIDMGVAHEIGDTSTIVSEKRTPADYDVIDREYVGF